MAKPTIIINGVELYCMPEQYQISDYIISSSNTGRNNKGDMVGGAINVKKKLTGTLRPISGEEALKIRTALTDLSRFFTEVTYLDIDGVYRKFIGYRGDMTYNMYSSTICKGKPLITGVQISIIEK